MPAFVRGLSIVRGEAVPVVDLAALLGAADNPAPSRFVTLRVAQGQTLALAVDEVLGVLSLSATTFHSLPPLLQDATQTARALAARDQQLLVLLDASRLVPDEVWRATAARGGAP
jgi:purine-binding chemotaxis protein CheW